MPLDNPFDLFHRLNEAAQAALEAGRCSEAAHEKITAFVQQVEHFYTRSESDGTYPNLSKNDYVQLIASCNTAYSAICADAPEAAELK